MPLPAFLMMALFAGSNSPAMACPLRAGDAETGPGGALAQAARMDSGGLDRGYDNAARRGPDAIELPLGAAGTPSAHPLGTPRTPASGARARGTEIPAAPRPSRGGGSSGFELSVEGPAFLVGAGVAAAGAKLGLVLGGAAGGVVGGLIGLAVGYLAGSMVWLFLTVLKHGW